MEAADSCDAPNRAAEPGTKKELNRSAPWFLCMGCLAAFSAAASAQSPTCTLPQKPMLDVELLLGRGKASEARWRAFLAHEVTPRFPDGLTVYETTGQWRDPARKLVLRERSRVLRIIVTADTAANDKIAAVAQAYKMQFRQKSVGVVTRPACVSF
jgi:hypothetical protein